MVWKLERKAGASISASDDKYPAHRKHTESAGNFKTLKSIYGDLVPDAHHFHEW